MVRLLVGLGNPGAEYAGHRHNVGFWLVDQLAELAATNFSNHDNIPLAGVGGLRLAKPQNYVNRSGLPVRRLCDYFKIPSENVMVAHDDLDLPLGRIRIKQGGGHGGHNGLRDLIAHIGENFLRLRIGIGHPGSRELVHGYVLSNPSSSEKQMITAAIEQALELRDDWLGGNIVRAQQHLHTN